MKPKDSAFLSTREAARIEMVRTIPRDVSDLDATFEAAVRIAAKAMHVDRVGIWTGVDGWRAMRGRVVFDARTGTFSRGLLIDLTNARAYGAALGSRRLIVADDAQSDPITSELGEYLKANDVRAMLDCPIFDNGELFGVVCHETVGKKREWTKADADFATSVSDMIGLYLAQHSAKEAAENLVRTREILEQSRVMESLGRMAAGVAHDFNNVLGAIGLSGELLARDAEPGSTAAKVAREIEPLVDHGKRMVAHLMSFAHRGPEPTTTIDLGATLEASRAIIEPLARDGIEVTLSVPASAVPVKIERSRFEQVLSNLVVNARDAMIGGGRLTITLERDEDARVAELRVADTGVGFDEKTRARLFEPFFSTKAGSSSGLGLPTVYGIVRDANGSIDVKSGLGLGATFVIRFPLES